MQRHKSISVVFCSLVLVAQLLAHKVVYGADGNGRFSIALAAAPGVDLKWDPADEPAFEGFTFYVTQITVKNKPWERLCMGYFNTRDQAAAKLKQVSLSYPGSWVIETVPATRRRILASSTSHKANIIPVNSISQTKTETRTSAGTKLSENQLDDLMLRAKTSFKKKEYSQAVRYLTAVIEAGEHKYSPEALELLGLARQRKGQNAHAAAIYEKYLEIYPTNEGAKRVQQRLAGLITASRAPRDEIRMESDASRNRLDTFGSFSQNYINDRAASDGIDTVTVISQLVSFIDTTTIAQTLDYDHQFRLISDHTYDWLEEDEDASEFRFIEMYYDLNLKKSGSSGRIGRQRLRIGGLLRRYDGITAGYQINPDMRINLLGGFPVEIDNKTSINQNKTFYGITFETGIFLEHWEMNLFYFKQAYDDLENGTSIGTEVRYNDKTKSIFGLIDYDTFYKEMNTVQLSANLLFDHGFTAYLNAFMTKTPPLSIENALIGRTEQSIEELKQNLNIEQIYQLALDRTAYSGTITLGGSKRLSEKFNANTDITFSRVEGTIASGGVPATPESGTNFLFSAQLVGNNLLMARDTGVLGIRYYDTDLSDTISFIGNTRFYITREWRINPRLQYDIREIADERTQNKLRVLLRTDYQIRNRARFDFEVGYDDIRENGSSALMDTSFLFFRLGYRLDF